MVFLIQYLLEYPEGINYDIKSKVKGKQKKISKKTFLKQAILHQTLKIYFKEFHQKYFSYRRGK